MSPSSVPQHPAWCCPGDVASSWSICWVYRFFPHLNYDAFKKLPLWLMPKGRSWGITAWHSQGEGWLSLWAFCVWHWGWTGLLEAHGRDCPGLLHTAGSSGLPSAEHPPVCQKLQRQWLCKWQGNKNLILPDE